MNIKYLSFVYLLSTVFFDHFFEAIVAPFCKKRSHKSFELYMSIELVAEALKINQTYLIEECNS